MTDDHHTDDATSVSFGVFTISSSRTLDGDESGDVLVTELEERNHTVVVRDLITDDEQSIRETIERCIDRGDVDAVLTTGGTGLTADDVTVEAVTPLFDREIPGFGEQFRAMSVDEVGPHGLLTRATAGVADGVGVFCLPGSEQAASFGVTELVGPIVGHVVGLTREERSEESTAGATLTHTDEDGTAQMVDVGAKPDTKRRAVAAGEIQLRPETIAAIRDDGVDKGDVIGTARIGAIRGAKHTWESVPLCHQIPITDIDVAVTVGDERVELTVAVETVGKTGCEMEALDGVTSGLNTVWDMVKAIEKDDEGQYPATAIQNIRVTEKRKEPLE